jgi:hypothetical protein
MRPTRVLLLVITTIIHSFAYTAGLASKRNVLLIFGEYTNTAIGMFHSIDVLSLLLHKKSRKIKVPIQAKLD